MIGKEIGAGNTENAKRLYKNTIFLIISVASSMFIINYILRKHFIKIFTNSEEI
jgi:Na+-driven multidrug efflux pump